MKRSYRGAIGQGGLCAPAYREMPPLKPGFIGASVILVVIGATLLALLPKRTTDNPS